LCYTIHGGQSISPTKGVAVAEGEFDEIEALKKSNRHVYSGGKGVFVHLKLVDPPFAAI
jgi:hypothetical protein